ncbi:DsbA family protein [Pseudogemmobacter sonorensis]|uniref:DsbA family protein n=1 Tax=Pseudogemmobacter sonorensis TaxID=2989681 RepID=UPI003697D7AA
MTTLTRRSLMALAATLASAPAWAQEAPAEEGAEAPATQHFTGMPSIGAADAPIHIVEFASYTCSHCANFHATAFKPLKTEYIDSGKVRFSVSEVYFDRYGLWAALVARCGGEMRYFGISDILFEQQNDWATAGDPTLVVQKLRTIGLTAGLTNEQLDACLSDTALVDTLVAQFETSMQETPIQGTPALLIDGELHGNMTYAELKKIIDSKLGG